MTNRAHVNRPAPRAGRTVVEPAAACAHPVNDFLSEGGATWDLAKSTVEKNDVVASLRRTSKGLVSGACR